MSRRILFVDDEPRVIRGLRRMLGALEESWVMEFAESGQEALEYLNTQTCDVVVSDFRMPGMNGHELLTKVKEQHPEIIRMLLSGQTDETNSLRSVGSAHQYLAKPCDPETLREAITRAFILGDLLENSQLKELISQLDTLPALPDLYQQLIQEIESENCSIENIGKIVSQDMGMTAKILKLVNSAFLGVPRNISNPIQAVNFIGLDTLRILVLTIKVFEKMNADLPSFLSMETIWNHSLKTGEFARKIMKAESADSALADDALAGGLLHDLGIILLASQLKNEYSAAVSSLRDKQTSLEIAERNVFGISHAEVGAYLLGLWGLNHHLIEAVAFHHTPVGSSEKGMTPLIAVQAANVFCHEEDPHLKDTVTKAADEELLSVIAPKEKIEEWRNLCLLEAE